MKCDKCGSEVKNRCQDCGAVTLNKSGYCDRCMDKATQDAARMMFPIVIFLVVVGGILFIYLEFFAKV